MAKSRNNLLGVGGQRTKLPRSQGQGTGPSAENRRSEADHKQELLRKMRERAGQRPADDSVSDDSAVDGSVADDSAQSDTGPDDSES